MSEAGWGLIVVVVCFVGCALIAITLRDLDRLAKAAGPEGTIELLLLLAALLWLSYKVALFIPN